MKAFHKVVAAAGVAILAVSSAPTGPAFADSVRDRQWYLKSMKLSQTRSMTTGSGVIVAVLDTGTYPHPDIRRNLLAGSDQTSSSGSDGRSDKDGHGTRMAALIAGHGHGNSSGIQGVAPSAKILPVVISRTGQNIASAVMAKGVSWAAKQQARVISISAGTGPGFDLQDAIDAAIGDDIVVIAAAGNTATGAIISYPSAFEGVLAVGATGRSGQHSSASVKDAKIQICAPGVDIISAQPRSGYGSATGTSDSTAIVSGAAALVRAKFPQLSAKDVIHRLTATADDIGPPGRDDECGFGRLNIVKALTADVPPLEGGATAAPSVSAPVSKAPGGVPVSSSAAAAPETEDAGGSSVLLFGGLAGLVAAGAVVLALALRRRRRF